LHEIPLQLLRGTRKGREARPQTYEKTWAFQKRKQLNRFGFVLHLYWAILGRLMRVGGPIFEIEPTSEQLLGRQLVIRAWK
jgi:hypothetical protein